MILLVLVGVGALMLPAKCATDSAGQCMVRTADRIGAVTQPSRPSGSTTAPTKPSASRLISSTFAKLQSTPPSAAGKAAIAPIVASRAPLAVKTRLVQTIAVHPDTPSLATPLGEIAALPTPSTSAGGQQPGATSAPAGTAAAAPAATPAVVPAPPPQRLASAAATAPAAPTATTSTPTKRASGTLMQVAGQGVTVRAGPSTSRQPLFNLAAGEKVTVSDKHRGWLHITDSKGRSGWAYSAYLHG